MKQNREELLEKIKDPKFYLENFCKIKGKTPGALLPFILNEAQKDLFNAIMMKDRIIILKARQLGFSTAAVGYFYHNTIMTPGTTTAIIGYNSSLTTELLDKVKTFYHSTPDPLRPTIHYNSKYEISFPKIDSKIIVLPSTEEVGRGYCLSNVLATELAFWDKADEKMSTLEASVPITGKLIVESTPNGQGNCYHRMWTEKNDYLKKEYGWWWGYSVEEIDIIEKRLNDPRKFAQEYGLSFLSSGRSVFSSELIDGLRKGILRLNDEITENLTNYRVIEDDGLRIYRQPDPNGIYVCGVDPSEGLAGGDFSAVTFFDRKTGEEVASYRGFLPPDVLAKKLNDWGRKFNNALMVVEINNHGLTVITVLKHLIYPSIFFRSNKLESLGTSMSDKMGWKTTRVTREILIDDFCKAIRERSLKLHSEELINEMAVFIYDDKGDAIAQNGYHDDLIFSAALAFQGFKVIYNQKLEQLNYSNYLPVNFSY